MGSMNVTNVKPQFIDVILFLSIIEKRERENNILCLQI